MSYRFLGICGDLDLFRLVLVGNLSPRFVVEFVFVHKKSKPLFATDL